MENGENDNQPSDNRKPMTEIQRDGCATMEQIRLAAGETTDVCQMKEVEKLLMYKEQRRKRPWPWKVDLEIGPDIQIPTTGYISTRCARYHAFCLKAFIVANEIISKLAYECSL